MADDCWKILAEGEEAPLSQEDAIALNKAAAVRLKEAAALGRIDDAEVLRNSLDEVIVAKLQKNRQEALQLKTRLEAMDRMKRIHNEQGFTPATALKSLLVGVTKWFPGAKLSIAARQNQLYKQYAGGLVNDLERKDVLRYVALGGEKTENEMALVADAIAQGEDLSGFDTRAVTAVQTWIQWNKALVAEANKAGADIRFRMEYLHAQHHNPARLFRAADYLEFHNNRGKAATRAGRAAQAVKERLDLTARSVREKVGRDANTQRHYEAWRDKLLEHLDLEETLGGVEFEGDPEDFLRSIYAALSSGVHYTTANPLDPDLFPTLGLDPSLAVSLSQGRVLIFKSARDSLEYNRVFGSGNMRDNMVHGMRQLSYATGMMETFGPNSAANFKMLKQYAQRLSDSNKADPRGKGKARKETRDELKALDKFYRQISGENDIPQNLTVAGIGSFFRSASIISNLGGATISAITDLPFQANELQLQGRGFFDSFGDLLRMTTAGKLSAEQKELLNNLNIMFEGAVGTLAHRLGSDDHQLGVTSSILNTYFKLNLLTPWTDFWRGRVSMVMSNHLGEQARLNWADVNPKTKEVLSLYGIGEKEMALYNKVMQNAPEIEGRTYLTSDLLDGLTDDDLVSLTGDREVAIFNTFRRKLGKDIKPEEVFRAMREGVIDEFKANLPEAKADQIDAFLRAIQNERTNARKGLGDKLRMFYVDRSEHAVPIPGAETVTYLKGPSGTVHGELWKSATLFKGFPVGVLFRVLAPTVTQPGPKGAQFAGLMLSTTMMGGMAMATKELLAGKEPRMAALLQGELDRELSTKLFLASMLQGGSLGLFGDFLFGEMNRNRYGGNFTTALLGPVLGEDVNDIADFLARVRDAAVSGDESARPAQQALKLLLDRFPNLFYTKLAVEYAFLNEMKEHLSPGINARYENNMRKQGSEFMDPFRPTQFQLGILE